MLYVALSGFYPGAEDFSLKCLEHQTNKDFELLFLDPRWDPNVAGVLKEFSQRTGVKVHIIPHLVQPGSRITDWSIWNTPYIYAESEGDLIFRFQSWRAISSNTIEALNEYNKSVGFERWNTEKSPDWYESYISTPRPRPFEITRPYNYPFPYGSNGDHCIRVYDMLEINGLDEPATIAFHFEDIEMLTRWAAAIKQGVVTDGITLYGFMNRIESKQREVLYPNIRGYRIDNMRSSKFQKPCPLCDNGGSGRHMQTKCPDSELVKDNLLDIGHLRPNDKYWYYCKTCDIPLFQSPYYFDHYFNGDVEPRSTIGLMGRWGRNLRKARKKCLRLPKEEQAYYAGVASFTDPEVFTEGR